MRCSPPPSWLTTRGARVDVLALSAKLHPAGAEAVRRAVAGGVAAVTALPGADVAGAALDRSPADLVLTASWASAARGRCVRMPRGWRDAAAGRIIAVDLPSGIDPDTGVGLIRTRAGGAHRDVRALKAGLILPDGCWRQAPSHWWTSAPAPTCSRTPQLSRS